MNLATESKIKDRYWSFTSLTIAFYVLLFSNDSDYALFSQLTALGIIFTIAIFDILIKRQISFVKSSFEIVLILLTLQSMLSAFCFSIIWEDTYIYSIYYSFVFLMLIVSLEVVVSSRTVDELILAFSVALIGMLLTIVVFNYDAFITALQLNGDDRWMLRLTPFNMHPNLVGYIFGGGAIVLGYKMYASTSWSSRALFGIFCLISILVILAASARGALVALLISSIVVFLLFFRNYRFTTIFFVFLALCIVGALIILNFDSVLLYATDLLELDSETRGLESNGSGRLELWQAGINLILSDSYRMFFGGGLRSASPEIIGFSTENSYITIILESGIFMGVIFFWMIFKILFKVRILAIKNNELIYFGVLHILLFSLVESIFNRYLLAIGNPFSLFVLMLFIFSGRKINQKSF